METTIRFKGNDYLLIGNLQDGGAIATQDDFEHGRCSFAHLCPDGSVKRFTEVVGDREDIEVTGDCEADIQTDAFCNGMAGRWGRFTEEKLMATLIERALTVASQLEEAAGIIRELCDSADQVTSPIIDDRLKTSVKCLGLSIRARKCLNRLEIYTLGELVVYPADRLLGTRNFGITALDEIRSKLREIGLSLKGD